MDLRKRVLKVLFWVAAMTAFIGPTLGIFLGYNQAGWASLVSSLVLMFATRFETIEELSFGPLKAKLRKKIEEVDNFIEPLNKLALTLSEVTLTQMMGEGRWGGIGLKEKFKAREKIDALLDNLNIEDDERSKIYDKWNAYLESDHANKIVDQSSQYPENFCQRLNSLRINQLTISPAADYRSLFVTEDLLTSEIDALIKDLEHFQQHRTLRRSDTWFQSDS